MEATSKPKELRPWHTGSFYKTRLAMISVAFLYCVPTNIPGFLSCSLIGWMVVDVIAILALRKNEVMVPIPAPKGSKQNRNEKTALRICIGVYVGCFAFVLAVAFGLIPLGESNFDVVLRGLIYLCANVAGWYLVSWLREVSTIMRQNEGVTTSAQGVASVALPGLPFTAVSQPTRQAQTLRLRLGSGGKP